ncbi:MAG: carboxypeptidase regulatory-like domain-containing protein [Isosphaeraceae bacterium]|nr:carboxypeptidase regulatory-like domain-containing protein [Isosphaeraceae bacterium]
MADKQRSTGWRGKNARGRSKKTAASIRQAIGLLIFTITAIAGAIIGLVVFAIPTPKPTAAGFWITRSSDPRLPDDPTSAADRAAFLESAMIETSADAFGESWSKAAAHLASRRENDSVVLYVSALAFLDDAGDVSILPADAVPDGDQGRLPLADVLAAVRECKSKSKLVILDIGRPVADGSLGQLSNDVAGRAVEQIEAIADPARLVLLACGPGQLAHRSELLGRSIFNYYVDEGLRGWADEKEPDGVVTARELGRFVASRVEDWAKRVRNVDQTPVLLGAAETDFKLVILPTSGNKPRRIEEPDLKARLDPTAAVADSGEKPEAKKDEAKKAEAEPPAARAGATPRRVYPDFLAAGWKSSRDRRAARATALAPRPLARLETLLLRSELAWRYGRPEAEVRGEFTTAAAAIDRQFAESSKIARPSPLPSIALASIDAPPSDPATAKAVADLLAARARKTEPGLTEEKLRPDVKVFLDKTPIRDEVELAGAILDVLSRPDPPQRRMYAEMIRFADLVLRDYRASKSLAPEATHLETLFLQQLAGLTPPAPPAPAAGSTPMPPGAGAPARAASVWPNELLAEAVASMRRGELLSADAIGFPWTRALVDRAAMSRHIAQVLMRSPGYVLPAEVDEAVGKSDGFDDQLAEIESILASAHRALEEANDLLPRVLPSIDSGDDADEAREWLETAAAAARLADLLEPPAAGPALERWSRPESALAEAQAMRDEIAAVESGAARLARGFTVERIQAALLAARGPSAPPEAWHDLDALLAKPLVPPDLRKELIEVADALDRQLHKRHFETTAMVSPDGEIDRGRAEESRRAVARADRAIGSLALGGIEVDGLRAPRDAFAQKPTASTLAAAGKAIRLAWKGVPNAIEAETDPTRRARKAWIVPGSWISPSIDNESTAPPTTQLRSSREALLWTWAAEFYGYLRDEVDSGSVIIDAAAAFDAFAKSSSKIPTIKIERDPSAPIPVLQPLEPRGTVSLLVTPSDAAASRDAKLRILTPPDAKLRVTEPTIPELEPRRPTKLGIEVSLDDPKTEPAAPGAAPGSRETSPAPKGLLVEMIAGGRPFFHRADVDFGSALEPLRLVLTDDPKSSADPLDRVALRAIDSPQNHYLWVRNPTGKPRNVEVRVSLQGDDTPLATARLRVAAGATAAIPAFTLPSPPPAPAGQPAAANPPPTPIDRPLQIRLYDSDRVAVDATDPPIDELIPAVDLSPASELIQVVEIKYTPANENNGFRNLLSAKVRAKTALQNGPCAVSLVLPKEGIPGLRGPAVIEQLSGTLKAQGDEVTLSATGLPLDDTADTSAIFYLSVDGDGRALKYRTTFDRQGLVPRTPQLDTRPALRISGEHLAEIDRPYPVAIQVDNPPDDQSTVVVGFLLPSPDGKPALRFDQTVPARKKLITLSIDPKGTLGFRGSIADQRVDLETRGLSGPTNIQATLLNSRARVEGPPRTLELILDGRPEIKMFELSKATAAAIQLRAAGGSQSGIASVRFFFGVPLDDKIPNEKEAVPGSVLPDGSYSAVLPIPKDAKGKLDVGVEFKNELGKLRFARLVHEVAPAAGAMTGPGGLEEKPKTGAVAGKVVFAGIEQPNLDVTVYNQKSEPVGKGKTDAKGLYRVEGIEPGTYYVYVTRLENNSQALEKVLIKAGETAKLDLDMVSK